MSEEHGRPVIVLGMHRSGTSLLARVVNLCGVRVDAESELMLASWENPRGYWEPRYLADLNDALFDLVGSAWYAPRAFGLRTLELPPSLRTRMQGRVSERTAEPSSFLWKDPRLSLTWPLWRPLLPDPVVLLCMRNPAAVAASLSVRNGFPRELSYALWELHVELALEYVKAERCTIVHYEQLLAEPRAQIGRVLEWLAATGVVCHAPPLLDAACDECVPGLDRQHREPDELEFDPLAEPEQKRLYARLWGTGVGERPAGSYDEARLRKLEDKLVPMRAVLEDRWWRKRAEHWQSELFEQLRVLSNTVSALESAAKMMVEAAARGDGTGLA